MPGCGRLLVRLSRISRSDTFPDTRAALNLVRRRDSSGRLVLAPNTRSRSSPAKGSRPLASLRRIMIISTLELTALPMLDARFTGPPCLPERPTYAHVRYVHATARRYTRCGYTCVRVRVYVQRTAQRVTAMKTTTDRTMTMTTASALCAQRGLTDRNGLIIISMPRVHRV